VAASPGSAPAAPARSPATKTSKTRTTTDNNATLVGSQESQAEREATAACADVTVAHEIVVSIHLQHLWACSGPNVIYTSAVTTGAKALGDATPTGTWQIYGKQTDRWLSGPGYSYYVHFWMPFYGAYGFHDAPWQTMAFGSNGYPKAGSHGCVHVPKAMMATLYSWAPIGATVHVTA
jgi:lipoprotein-anchoring transpeptidase ErfK/SrfK